MALHWTLPADEPAQETLYVLSPARTSLITGFLLAALAVRDGLARSRPWQGIAVISAIIIALHFAQVRFNRTVLTTTAVEQRRWTAFRKLYYRDVVRAGISGGKYLVSVYLTSADGTQMKIRGPNFQVLRVAEILKQKIPATYWEIA
jgi:hypothetical protein